MALVNTSKPTTSITNTVRVAFAVLWSTILTTWASETRTWQDLGSIISNSSKPTTNIINVNKP